MSKEFVQHLRNFFRYLLYCLFCCLLKVGIWCTSCIIREKVFCMDLFSFKRLPPWEGIFVFIWVTVLWFVWTASSCSDHHDHHILQYQLYIREGLVLCLDIVTINFKDYQQEIFYNLPMHFKIQYYLQHIYVFFRYKQLSYCMFKNAEVMITHSCNQVHYNIICIFF